MKKPTDEKSKVLQLRQERVRWLIEQLVQKCRMTQHQIAQRASVTSQYLSDVKNGQRTLTEPFAHCLADTFGVDYLWLLGQGSDPAPVTLRGSAATLTKSLQLPLLGELVEGDPRDGDGWDGAMIELAGAAAAKAAKAQQPYIVRFAGQDPLGRLRKGDLLLISQVVASTAELQILRQHTQLILARCKNTGWQPLTGEKILAGPLSQVGWCLGIVWGPT